MENNIEHPVLLAWAIIGVTYFIGGIILSILFYMTKDWR